MGVAVVMPFGWPVVPAADVEPDPELHASRAPPDRPTAAIPTPPATPLARKERRSIRSAIS
jgi:hypothetical protein